ncbi:hypothetical protein Pla163_18900 [Planctomycetes bacterium Pla163]|uniref:Uncharacterized protein n=1 Tax=Rohdeia mirabilis TaxID=2528008 RepID=A0A518CZW7_9BACT|nr:hypothetical protein Pla163_18900 [Planctomycetes bacterium Pla163]
MRPADPQQFFVGYVDGVPQRTRSFLAPLIALCLVVVASVAGLAATLQNDAGDGVFEFGVTKPFAGWIERLPHPVLVSPDPSGDGHSRYLLSAFGKHGADELFTGAPGAWYELEGTLVYRDGRSMIEVVAGSVSIATTPTGAVHPTASPDELGVRTLTGEIVDSKCYLGVMKPGNLKSHRACAVRCISGGVPPVLLVRDDEGYATYYLLVDDEGGAVNERVLPMVALPIEITGEVERHGDLLVLRSDPDSYTLLHE